MECLSGRARGEGPVARARPATLSHSGAASRTRLSSCDRSFLEEAAAFRSIALGRTEEAIAALERRLIRNPNTDVSRVLLAAICGHLGRHDEARIHWDQAMKINPAYSLEQRRRILPYRNPADFERIVEGLRKARLAD